MWSKVEPEGRSLLTPISVWRSVVESVKINLENATTGRQGFSSPHTGGCHFLMGDGRVRFIGENIDHNLTDAVDSTFERI